MTDSIKKLPMNMCVEIWRNVKPPVRPSEQMVAIYEDYVNKYCSDSGDWGLLGCTPELRSLAAEYASSLCCLDLNKDHYHGYAELCKQHPKESFMLCDWVCPGLTESFDLVLGDGSISMVSLHQYDEFLKNLHDMLLPGGCAFLRIQVSNTNPFNEPSEVIAWHRKNHSDQPIFRTSAFYMQILWQDSDLGAVNTEIYRDQMQKLYDAGEVTDEEYQQFMGKITPCPISYVEQEAFEAACEPYFDILDARFPEDFACSNVCPVYALKKK